MVTQEYCNSDHMVDFCVVKLHMVLLDTKIRSLKFTKRVQTNRKTLHMLLETNDALRVERIYILIIIFMV